MKLKKSTKGTHVYEDDSENAPVKQVYIQRSAFTGQPTETIELSITLPTGEKLA